MKEVGSSAIIVNNRLVIVGGTGRNVGKTEFICRLIKKTSTEHPVYAIKVSAIFPDEELFHGNHLIDEENLNIVEEKNKSTNKDTSRMLRAGAIQVFYLRTRDSGIKAGFDAFLKQIPENSALVCESNSLGQFVKPALSLMVKPVSGQIKPRAITRLENADLVVVSDGKSVFPELQEISFSETSGWRIQVKK